MRVPTGTRSVRSFAALAVAVAGTAVLAALGAKPAGVAVLDQGIDVAVGDDMHAAAVSAIAAVRAPLGFIFLAPERGDAVASVAGANKNFRLVDEFHDCFLSREMGKQKALPARIGLRAGLAGLGCQRSGFRR
jgi:hypothetical protein